MTLLNAYVSQSISPAAEIPSCKSFIAYASALALPATILLVAYPAGLLEPKPGFALGVIGALGLLVKFAEFRSHFLFVDTAGMCEHSESLPLAKGVRGLRWEDLQEVAFEVRIAEAREVLCGPNIRVPRRSTRIKSPPKPWKEAISIMLSVDLVEHPELPTGMKCLLAMTA